MNPGDRVGPYRIEAPIGSGAMGVVVRAVHETLGRTVALKLLAPGIARDEDARQRFVREVRLAAQVVHPNLVLTFDGDVVDETPYLAMELVEGEDLARRLKRLGHIPLVEALGLIE